MICSNVKQEPDIIRSAQSESMRFALSKVEEIHVDYANVVEFSMSALKGVVR